MSSPTFANPSFEELGGRREIATLASTPHWRGGGMRSGLATVLDLGCIAMAGALTIGVFFGLACYFLAQPIDEIIAASARHPLEEASLAGVARASAPVGGLGSAPTSGPTPPGTTGPPGQAVQPAAAARASPAERRLGQVHQNRGLKHIENAAAEIVSGPVSEVPDAMTWVIGGQILHLWGVRPDLRPQPRSLAGLVARVNADGPITCRRQAHSTRYRCSTATGEDVAETELLSGIGRAADGATIAYRSAEAQAREKGASPRPGP
jgi:hypothetical protein